MSNLEGLTSAIAEEIALWAGTRSTRVTQTPDVGARVLSGIGTASSVNGRTITFSGGPITSAVQPGMILRLVNPVTAALPAVSNVFVVQSGVATATRLGLTSGMTNEEKNLRARTITISDSYQPVIEGYITEFGTPFGVFSLTQDITLAEDLPERFLRPFGAFRITIYDPDNIANIGTRNFSSVIDARTVRTISHISQPPIVEIPARPVRFRIEGVEQGDMFEVTSPAVPPVFDAPVPIALIPVNQRIAVVSEDIIKPFPSIRTPELGAYSQQEIQLVNKVPKFTDANWRIKKFAVEAVINSVTPPGTVTVGGFGFGLAFTSLSWEIYEAPQTYIEVESMVVDPEAPAWADQGEVFIEGTRYTYVARTPDAPVPLAHELQGIMWWDSGELFNADNLASVPRRVPAIAGVGRVPGARYAHRPLTDVVDGSGIFSAADRTARQKNINTAVGENLEAIGTKLSFSRPTALTSDEILREVLRAIGYAPRGTIVTLYEFLDAVFGAGNYYIFEDLTLGSVQWNNTVFFFRDLIEELQGKTFLDNFENIQEPTVGTVTFPGPPPTALDISSVLLAAEPARSVPLRLTSPESRPTHSGSRLVAYGDTVMQGDKVNPNKIILLGSYVGVPNINIGDVFEWVSRLPTQWRRATIKSFGFVGPNPAIDCDPIEGAPAYQRAKKVVDYGPGGVVAANSVTMTLTNGGFSPFVSFTQNIEFTHVNSTTPINPPILANIANRISDFEIELTAPISAANLSGLVWIIRYTDLYEGPEVGDPVSLDWKIWRPYSNFRHYSPTGDDVLEYAGDTSTNQWLQAGAGVTTIVPRQYMQLSPLIGTFLEWRHIIRNTSDRVRWAEIHMRIPVPGSLGSGALQAHQVLFGITEDSRNAMMGVLLSSGTTYRVGFTDSTGGFINPSAISNAATVAVTAFSTFRIEVAGQLDVLTHTTQRVARLYVDGRLADQVNYSQLALSVGSPMRLYVSVDDTFTGFTPTIWVKHMDWGCEGGRDFWGVSANTNVVSPNIVSLFASPSDIGKTITIESHRALNPDSGSPVGEWLITSVAPLTVNGRILYDAKVESANRSALVAIDDYPFIWPYMKGMNLVILSGANAGTYPIRALLDPETGLDLDLLGDNATISQTVSNRISYAIDSRDEVIIPVRTSRILLDTTSISPLGLFEPGPVDSFRIEPNFATSGAGTWVTIGDGGVQVGNVGTHSIIPLVFPVGYTVLVEAQRTLVDSAHVEHNAKLLNANNDPFGPDARYPFYLADDWGWTRQKINDALTAAGVIADFDSLYIEKRGGVVDPETGVHIIDQT